MPRPIHKVINTADPVVTFCTDQYSQGPLTVQTVANGAVDHSLEVTHDDPFQQGGAVNWFNHVDAATINCVGSYQATLINMPRAVRVLFNGGAGDVDVVIGQLTTNG